MKITCPSCHAELTLDVVLQHEQARRAVARLASVSLPFGALVLRYVALFKPESRAMSIDRMVRLVLELLPDIERQAITRKGRDWRADADCWRTAIETVLAMRDAGKLRLPLTGHGLLHEVAVGLAEQAEAATEREREAARRALRAAGERMADGQPIGAVLSASADAPKPAPRAAVAAPGPSREVLEKRARIEAHLRLRQQGAPATDHHQE